MISDDGGVAGLVIERPEPLPSKPEFHPQHVHHMRQLINTKCHGGNIAPNEVLEGVFGKESRHEHENHAGTQVPGVNHEDPWMSSWRIVAKVGEAAIEGDHSPILGGGRYLGLSAIGMTVLGSVGLLNPAEARGDFGPDGSR
jgi:hypothetical protein